MGTVLIFGSRGYLGSLLLSIYEGAATPPTDIADQPAVAAALDSVKPDVVISAAGMTGRPNVDWCEEHKMETLRSNVTGPLVLLEECTKRGIYWVHLGSGCIYEGDNGGRGFAEDDPPNFSGSFYSRTKRWSDEVLRDFPGMLNLRLRMPFDDTTSPRNLIMKLKGYKRVLDVPNSLTHIPDFLHVAQTLIGRKVTGTFNVVNDGALSPFDIMQMYRKTVDPGHTFERLSLRDLPAVVKAGRSNCVLSCAKLREEGIVMPKAVEAMEGALQSLKRAAMSAS